MRIVEARIEIPMGSQNKYEIDHKTGKIKLNRVLYSAAFYPAEYGFIEDTLSEDGDPLDILVLTSSPTFPGCYIDSRIIGAMDMVDSGEVDTKLLARRRAPASAARAGKLLFHLQNPAAPENRSAPLHERRRGRRRAGQVLRAV